MTGVEGVTRARLRSRADRRLSPYLYVAPFFVLFLAFQLFPMLFTGWVSLHDWHILGAREWVGAGNYTGLWTDPRFLRSLANTFSILVLSSVPQLALALVLASVLHYRIRRGTAFFRISLLVPNVTSTVAVALVFESIFGLHHGLANAALDLLGLDPVNWHGDRFASHVAIATMVMWRWTGYNALIYLAGLLSIPRELHEAAQIDGASRVQEFVHVTLPMLRPVVIFTVVLSTIGGLQIFAEPYLFAPGVSIDGGSNNQFLTTTLYLYGQGFRQFKLGYASAIAMVLFAIIVLTSLVNLSLARRIRSAD